MARREFPPTVRDKAIARANGCCEKCSAVLKKGEAEIDHILPDALGGKPELANAMVLCRVCHSAKTAIDVGQIRKADRQRRMSNGAKKATGSFPKAPKPPKPVRDKLPMPPASMNPLYRKRATHV